jgi:hypothetical protein
MLVPLKISYAVVGVRFYDLGACIRRTIIPENYFPILIILGDNGIYGFP